MDRTIPYSAAAAIIVLRNVGIPREAVEICALSVEWGAARRRIVFRRKPAVGEPGPEVTVRLLFHCERP
jgi:hypothetical protein